MKIINVNNNKYIDSELFTFINSIWLNYDVSIDDDSNIFFSKNTTVARIITDYHSKKINRVIKREKADYVIINRFDLSNYPQFYDNGNITDDDTKELVYGIYNQSLEVQDTVELILDFINRQQEVKYVNQDKLNESLNNGFILDKESYTIIKELVDSPHEDNHLLACNMLINSDLKSNWHWILYIYYKKSGQFKYDKKNIIFNYLGSLNLSYRTSDLFNTFDSAMSVVTDNDVRDRYKYLIKSEFSNKIKDYFSSLGSNKFILDDFKIRYDDK